MANDPAITYRMLYLSVYEDCLRAGYSTNDSRAYAQLEVEDHAKLVEALKTRQAQYGTHPALRDPPTPRPPSLQALPNRPVLFGGASTATDYTKGQPYLPLGAPKSATARDLTPPYPLGDLPRVKDIPSLPRNPSALTPLPPIDLTEAPKPETLSLPAHLARMAKALKKAPVAPNP